jgi:hypothetical protein
VEQKLTDFLIVGFGRVSFQTTVLSATPAVRVPLWPEITGSARSPNQIKKRRLKLPSYDETIADRERQIARAPTRLAPVGVS